MIPVAAAVAGPLIKSVVILFYPTKSGLEASPEDVYNCMIAYVKEAVSQVRFSMRTLMMMMILIKIGINFWVIESQRKALTEHQLRDVLSA